MQVNEKIAKIQFDGGTLCLDFANTVHHRKKDPMPDYLHHILDLIAWAKQIQLIDTDRQALLNLKANDSNKESNHFFKESIKLREVLYQIFYALSMGKPVGQTELKKFNNFLQKHYATACIYEQQGKYQQGWNLPADSFLQITAPIVKDAYLLLSSDKLNRIKECPSCGWLFLDSSKNGKRRWCSMKSCGSSVKALDWYHRQKTK